MSEKKLLNKMILYYIVRALGNPSTLNYLLFAIYLINWKKIKFFPVFLAIGRAYIKPGKQNNIFLCFLSFLLLFPFFPLFLFFLILFPLFPYSLQFPTVSFPQPGGVGITAGIYITAGFIARIIPQSLSRKCYRYYKNYTPTPLTKMLSIPFLRSMIGPRDIIIPFLRSMIGPRDIMLSIPFLRSMISPRDIMLSIHFLRSMIGPRDIIIPFLRSMIGPRDIMLSIPFLRSMIGPRDIINCINNLGFQAKEQKHFYLSDDLHNNFIQI